MSFRMVLTLAGVCFGLLLSMPAHSQTLGRISGIVTDSSGGAVADATVTVTDVARGVARTVATDSGGQYSAPNLVLGSYSVHVVYMGFQAFDRQNIQIGVGGDVHVDVTLQPGAQTQVVTVTEEAPTITTTNAQLEGTISSNALSDLPFSGHNYVQLLGLLPTFQLRPGSGAGRAQNSANGLPGEFNVYILDGVADQKSGNSTSVVNASYPAGGPEQAVMMPTEAIQEFNVVTNAKAEFGWRPGAQINVGLKSGANAIHGTAYALGRNTALMAQNAFFATKSETAFENFGGTFGGAVKKDKLFYLFGYEGQRYTVGNPRSSNVPTTASGLGPSSSLPDAINDLLAHGYCNPATAGCTRPISQLSLNLAGCVLTPSVQCTANKGLFANNLSSTTFPVDFPTFGGNNNGVARADFHPNERNVINGWFFDGLGEAVVPVSSVNQPYWSSPLLVGSRVARAWWTWIPNSAWVNDLRFGWDWTRTSNSPSYDCDSASGAPDYAKMGFVSGSPICGFPAVTIAGFTGNVLAGAGGNADIGAIYRWLDNVSYTHGTHQFKFGGEILYARFSQTANGSAGTLAFDTSTAGLNAFGTGSLCPTPSCTSGTPTALENFFAGSISSGAIQTGTVRRDFTNAGYAFFGQDDWRIFPRLTLNFGLRYEHTLPLHEANNLLGNIDLTSPSGLCQAGVSGCVLYKNRPTAIAPRFGVAWDVTGKATTVVRAGFNISYEQPWMEHFFSSQAQLANIPTGLPLKNGSTVVTTPGGTINLASLAITPTASSPIPWAVNTPVFAPYAGASSTCTNGAPCAIGGIADHLQYPMVLGWNVGIQHAITSSLTLEANYVGNHGQHLNGFYDINKPSVGAGGNGRQARRPYTLNGKFPWFSTMTVFGAYGNRSNYNALQVTLRERVSHGLTFLAAYTYAHALASANPLDINNPDTEYGNASSDIRHRVTFGPSYTIPGRKGFAQMLEGWQVSSTVSIYSGRLMNATDKSNDLSGTGDTIRWTLAGDANDFKFGKYSAIPCFVSPTATGAFAAKSNGQNICTVGLPQACINAANTEVNGPAGVANNTGIAELNRIGCYMMGNTVMVPPAQGTYGTMGPFQLKGKGFSEWDMSIIKTWNVKEKVTAQFRTEIYNVTNSVKFADPSATLTTPSSFGQSSATTDVGRNSSIVGTGGPRKIQLGLKLVF